MCPASVSCAVIRHFRFARDLCLCSLSLLDTYSYVWHDSTSSPCQAALTWPNASVVCRLSLEMAPGALLASASLPLADGLQARWVKERSCFQAFCGYWQRIRRKLRLVQGNKEFSVLSPLLLPLPPILALLPMPVSLFVVLLPSVDNTCRKASDRLCC